MFSHGFLLGVAWSPELVCVWCVITFGLSGATGVVLHCYGVRCIDGSFHRDL